MIKKILITNRGEIAVRVIRSCSEMDIKTVAVYSEVDRVSPHVLKADEAYCIGSAQSSESYLNIPNILKVLELSGADAVHPGYGFLSENAGFATEISKLGIKWIGPSPESITLLGDKMASRKLAKKISMPIVPGTVEPVNHTDNINEIANTVGYPVLVKAAGGGGGKGMRIVQSEKDLNKALDRAKSEAKHAFTDDRIYIEKYIEEPHHIEIQIFSDNHGNIVSLGERECSVQRRYQKIIEETPSPFINESLRKKLSKMAISIAHACDYIGAGTVEFLVDNKSNYYFLEMNTRLQVEHPITEMVTGYDLVKEQICVADGKPLSFEQSDIRNEGHSMECRIYAEDGFNNFSPSIGKINELEYPHGLGVRLDDGIRSGQEITPFYDPLLIKLITWGKDRNESLKRMVRALNEFHVVGINTTIPFCLMMIQHESFKNGLYSTNTLSEIKDKLIEKMKFQSENHSLAAGIVAVQHTIKKKNTSNNIPVDDTQSSTWLHIGKKDNLR